MCNIPSEEKHTFFEWLKRPTVGLPLVHQHSAEALFAAQKQRHAELLRNNPLHTKVEIKGTTLHTVDVDVLNQAQKKSFECLMCKETDESKRSKIAGGMLCNYCQSKLDLERFCSL